VVEIVLASAVLAILVVVLLSSNAPRDRGDERNGKSQMSGRASAHDQVVTLTAANWEREVIESKVPVVVDFWAPWCMPCRMLAPAIDQVADRYAGKVKVAKLDIDKAPSIAARYGIKAIPQVFLFHGQEQPRPLWVHPGDLKASEESIAKELDSVLQ
jgi:thioredoxin 1